jgi:hypothetical protein
MAGRPDITSLRFGTKVHFVGNDAFRELPAIQSNESVDTWTMEQDQFLTDTRQTTSIACCLAGGMTRAPSSTVFHLRPGTAVPGAFNTQIAPAANAQLRRLQTMKTISPDGPHAFLIGAHGVKVFDEAAGTFIANPLRTLFSRFKLYFNSAKVPFTWFFGTKVHEGCDIQYVPQNDTWYVNTSRHKEGAISSAAALKERYEQIHVAPGDEVWINGVEVKDAASVLNKEPAGRR